MSRLLSRGALIVLEGCDRSGKSTQCLKLVDALNADGLKAKLWRFPDRSTPIGRVIEEYLEQKNELDDHVVHLLFAANRWEAVPSMKELLMNGMTLIVDRYSYSGVAFSAAKQGLSVDWCRQPEVGLPSPDAVIFLKLAVSEAAGRAQYGQERYEETRFQQKVSENYDLLHEKHWQVIDASESISEVHSKIKAIADKVIAQTANTAVGKLWMDDDNT